MANGTGGGAPPGLDPYNQSIPVEQLRQSVESRAGAFPMHIVKNDPGFQPPADPLRGVAGRTSVVYRDIPIVAVQNAWTVAQVIGALASHTYGIFAASGQLVDDLIADPRVRATLDSRMAGLFSRKMIFKPANKSRAAKEVLDAWVQSWPYISSGGALKQIGSYANLFGFWPAQLVWKMPEAGDPDVMMPRLMPWHARYTYYQWDIRKYVAISQDGSLPIFPGDGKWVLHAPRGEYRGWMWGSIRAVAEPWLLRHFAFRDMARFSEVHGMPFRKGKVPAAAAEDQRQRFENQLSNLGVETTMILPQGVDASNSYDVELEEATSQSWQIFPGLVDRCDMDIVLAILMQNLTTEVTGGSFAATSAHMDIRQQGIQDDNEAWRGTIRHQIARPFAALNFGDADLAPITEWDVTPQEDYTANTTRFQLFGQAMQILRQGGVAIDDANELRRFAKSQFGISLPASTKLVEPDSGSGSPAADEEKQAAHKELQR
jgi:hypothetical protein